MGDLIVTIVDACLRDGAGGSPTAVSWDAPLSESERRQLPRIAGTSHAVFVSADGEGGHSLRFFTQAGELPACGHGTVAALAFLAGDHEYDGFLRTANRAFAGRATRERDHAQAAFDPGDVQLREATAEERELAVDALAPRRATRLNEIWVGTIGRPRLLVAMPSISALAGLNPDQASLREACDRLGLLGCYAYCAPPATAGHLAARMFAPSIGVPEDIANANSTACLAARLARQGISEISVDMGDALGRPSTITAAARQIQSGLEIRVGGTARITTRIRLGRAELRSG